MIEKYNDDLASQVLGALTNDFQTARMIAAQCVFAPDRIARKAKSMRKSTASNEDFSRQRWAIESAKSSLVSQRLTTLTNRGVVERKLLGPHLFGYRKKS